MNRVCEKDQGGIALALGAGAFRGLAHLGVLQVLERERIPIKAITGSSIGAVVGSLYCAGVDLDVLMQLAVDMRTRQLLDPALKQPALFAGKKIQDLLCLFLRSKRFEDLPIPLGVTATDLVSGEEVLFTRGEILKPVMASLAVPGVFPPVKSGSRVLADGGLLSRLPVKAARQITSAPVVGVSLEPPRTARRFERPSDVIIRSLELVQMEVQRARCPVPDVLIRPDVGELPAAYLTRAADCISAGAEAARAHMPRLWELAQK